MGDYDFEPKTGKTLFLRLKNKGDSVTVRIASKPYREPKVWKEGERAPMQDENAAKLTQEQWARIMGDPDYNITEVFHWIVIDREDGAAKFFTGTPGIYKSIKEYAQMAQWGDPTKYDLQITRTEEPGRNYYTVVPHPNKTDLTAAEEKAVNELDIKEKIPNSRALSDTQIDDITDYLSQHEGSTTKPIEGVGNKSKLAAADEEPLPPEEPDVVIEDIGDEPINLDDIPF